MAATTNFFLSDKLTESKKASVLEVCKKLGVAPSWLMAVIHFETAGSLSPAQKNSIGSVGLIQFTRDKDGVEYKIISGKKYMLSELAKMTFEQQMDVVYLYLKQYAGRIKSFTDLYLAVFFPLAIGKPDSFVLETKRLSASIIAKQNKIFDADNNNQLTKGEVTGYFSRRYKEKWVQINVPSPFKPASNTLLTLILLPASLFFLLLVLLDPASKLKGNKKFKYHY